MSSRRMRTSRNREDEIMSDLVLRLQALIPATSPGCNRRVPASKILKETCNYIKSLQREVDNLGERLSQQLDSMENNGVAVDILRDLLQQ